jgi:LysM repeat protein
MKRFLIPIVMALALVLAACTRSASTAEVVPTAAPQGVGSPAPNATGTGDDLMNAFATQLAQTATAQAAGGIPEVPAQATATQLAPQPTVAPTAAPPTAAPTVAPLACANPYTVKAGDWFLKIARECRLDPAAFTAANPGINRDRLFPGQRLNLPGPVTAVTPAPGATPAACTGTYTVKRGDNLFRIAFNCGFTTEQLARLNNIAFPYRIYPGDVIRYP